MSSASDFAIENGVLKRYTGSGGDVVIPEGVSFIEMGAFQCNDIVSITIPAGVTGTVGTFEISISRCSNLKRIYVDDQNPCSASIDGVLFDRDHTALMLYPPQKEGKVYSVPEGVRGIWYCAFEGCNNLTSVELPTSLTSIAGGAFAGCKNLVHIELPTNLTDIGLRAFCGCSNLKSIEIPENVEQIRAGAFSGCQNLTNIIFRGNGNLVLNEDIFDGVFPEKLVVDRKLALTYLTDELLEKYVLTSPVWSRVEKELQVDIFMSRQEEKLFPAYFRCITEPELLGEAILSRLTRKCTATECKAAANFMALFAQRVSPELLQQMYRIIKPLKLAAKICDAIEANPVLMNQMGNSHDMRPLSEIDKVLAEALTAAWKTVSDVKNDMTQLYSLKPSELPKITCADGTQADDLVLSYLLTVHERFDRKNAREKPTFSVAYLKAGLCENAKKIVALLDEASLQSAIRALADENLGSKGRSKKLYLAYPICRYADAALMDGLTSRAPKWASATSGNNAPPLATFRSAVIFSETRAAMLFADKYNELEDYAEIRGTDADTIRDRYLSEVGLDAQGGKIYDLGNQTVTARLQEDLSFLVELPGGKTAKALPKKGADAEKYATANEDFSRLKKNVKKIVKNRSDILFEHFLSGHSRKAQDWQESYLHNPLLRSVAKLLVWSQGKHTFTLVGERAICSDGTPYAIGEDCICLAHPMEMQPEDLKAWQKYFTAHSIRQPFEQIWEPVVNASEIKPDRYKDCWIPYYRFKDKDKHGIHVKDEDFHNFITISFDDCEAVVERDAWSRHELSMDDRFAVQSISVPKLTRKANHIISYLDRVSIHSRIERDDTGIAQFLHCFTLAQITEFLKIAEENDCTNVKALLLDYKNRNYADFDPMEEFSLEG